MQRDDRLPGVDDLACARGAHVDDAVDRRVDLGVGEPHVGLGALRRGRGLLLLRWPAAGCGGPRPVRRSRAPARPSARCASTCFVERRRRCDLRDLVGASAPDRAAAAVPMPCFDRLAACARSSARAFSSSASRRRLLRFGRRQRRLGLRDLLGDLPLLRAQRRLAFAHLRRRRPRRCARRRRAPARSSSGAITASELIALSTCRPR